MRRRLALLVLLAATAVAADPWPFAVDATPREGKPGRFRLWLPDGDAPVRAAFLFTWYGSYEGYSAGDQIRVLARELRCAVIASDNGLCGDGDDPTRVFDALKALAATSAHPEVANLPLVVFGHSNSNYWSGTLARLAPDRIVAWVAMKSAFGGQFDYPELARIPGMVVSGEKDDSYFGDQLATVRRMRRDHHALVHMVVEADGPHWPTDPTFALQNAFLRHVFYRRVPYDADARLAPPKLLDLREEDGWLGQNLDGERVQKVEGDKRWWVWDRPVTVKALLEIAPFASYPGDRATASWFPGGDYAKLWQRYCATLETTGCETVPPTLIEAWKQRRAPVDDDGLASDALPQQAKRLRGPASPAATLKELRAIAADPARAEATEAARLVARAEALADERLAQAQRLEATHPPTAIAAYQALTKRWDGTPAADTAKTRLASKELKRLAQDWRQLARMNEIASALKPAGRPDIGDAAFVKANGPRLQELQALGRDLIATGDERAAAAARAVLGRYGFPLARSP